MTQTRQKDRQQRVYRIDRFLVPDAAREAFLARVGETHDLLRMQPGFLRDLLLEEEAGPGVVSIITFVEWENQRAIDNARRSVSAMHERTGFNPKAALAQWGLRAEIGLFRPVGSRDASPPDLHMPAEA